MALSQKTLRWLLLASAGVGSFYGAARWARPPDASVDGVVDAVIAPASRRAAPVLASPSASAALAVTAVAFEAGLQGPAAERSRSIPRSGSDPFTSMSWLPPPPPPPPPEPAAPPPPPAKPSPPSAPPLPFVFVGMLEQAAAQPAAFLAKDDILFVASVGDILDNHTYRVEALTADEVVMTYLPLNIKQRLRIPAVTQ